jgi:hypothetical protein
MAKLVVDTSRQCTRLQPHSCGTMTKPAAKAARPARAQSRLRTRRLRLTAAPKKSRKV